MRVSVLIVILLYLELFGLDFGCNDVVYILHLLTNYYFDCHRSELI
jgi:hypothetical protein